MEAQVANTQGNGDVLFVIWTDPQERVGRRVKIMNNRVVYSVLISTECCFNGVVVLRPAVGVRMKKARAPHHPELPADIVRLRTMWHIAFLSTQNKTGWGHDLLQPCCLCKSDTAQAETRTCGMCCMSMHPECCARLRAACDAMPKRSRQKLSRLPALLCPSNASQPSPICPFCQDLCDIAES